MDDYIEREAVLVGIENEYKNVEKIKTPFAKIIVEGTVEKPYYSILWLDKENKEYNVGYSSYCLDYVFKWMEVVFEIVAADEPLTAEGAPVVRCRDCKHAWIHPCGYVYCHRDGRNAYEMTFNLDSFCSYGERKDNG